MELLLIGASVLAAALSVGAGALFYGLYLRRLSTQKPRRRWLAVFGGSHLILVLGSTQAVASGLRDAADPWTWLYVAAWAATLLAAAKILRR